MATQVSFTADKDLKRKALLKAKNEGITLKAVLIYAMKGFVEGKISLGLQIENNEPDVQELSFADKKLNKKASRLAKLLK